MNSDKAPREPTLFDLPLHDGSSSEVAQAPAKNPPAENPRPTNQGSATSARPERDSKAAPPSHLDTSAQAYAPLLPFREEPPTDLPAVADTDAPEGTTDAAHERGSAPTEITDAQLLVRRFKGTLLDLAVTLAVCALLVALTSILAIRLSLSDWPGFLAFGLPFSFLWQVLPLGFRGRTPGMGWSQLAVVDDAGQGLSFWQASCRWFGFVMIVLTLGLAGLLTLSGRSLADRLSSSKVVATRSSFPRP